MSRFEGEVFLLPYALRRIRERGLTQAEVEEAVREPEELLSGAKGRVIAQRRTLSPRRRRPALLRVIFEEQAHRRVIVNVYLTSKVGKYRGTEP